MSDPIDIQTTSEPDPKPQQAMTVRDAVQALDKVATPEKQPLTAAQAKVEAVASLTFKAYERASMLTMTPEEIKALQADFPDEAFKPGAAGKEHLIYIEHAFLRDRLNAVVGLGQWALIPRSRWAEDFRTANGKPASRVYVEAMLLVRGAFVAEAVGEMEYYPNNASQNYGDAVEGAKTAALRRCCKEFGIGLQAWKKDWCEGWWERRRSGNRRQPTAPPAPVPEPKPATAEQPPKGKPTVDGLFVPVATVKLVHESTGTRKTDGKKWVKYSVLLNDGIADLEAITFSKTMAGIANTLANSGRPCELQLKRSKVDPNGWDIESIIPRDDAGQGQDDLPMDNQSSEPAGVTP